LFIVHRSLFIIMDWLWLGYDGLSIRFAHVAAVLLYHPSLDARIIGAYGRVPANIRAVVVTDDGAFLPSSWPAEQLRRRWSRWRVKRKT
jgi:hypothetical protein